MLYYLDKSPDAADRFIEEVETALGEIAEFPDRYAIREGDVHARVLTTFPFTIFYRVSLDEVTVSSIGHNSREQGHWLSRL